MLNNEVNFGVGYSKFIIRHYFKLAFFKRIQINNKKSLRLKAEET